MDKVGAPGNIKGEYRMGLSAKTNEFMADKKTDEAQEVKGTDKSRNWEWEGHLLLLCKLASNGTAMPY